MDFAKTAELIIRHIGGEQNVASLVHCATRLRFKLNQRDKADKKAIMALDGVVTVMESGGQFQVVIGNDVSHVYREIGKQTSLLSDTSSKQSDGEGDKGSAVGRVIDIIAGIFTPLLGIMAGAGVLKGVLQILTSTGVMTPDNTTYIILYAAADSLFYFLPVLLAFTAARKFDANPFIAATIAGALIYPSIIELANGNVETTFFGIPVVMMKYSSTVIPIILAVLVMGYFERFLNRRIHQSVRTFITPFVLLVTILPLTLLAFGPFGVYVGNGIAAGILYVFSLSPIIAGAIVAMSWQVLVIFGVHWGIIPIFINNITVQGYDNVKPVTAPAIFAQAGAALGVMLKTKNKKLKALSGSTAITGLFGITEPIVYGVTLPLKKPFIMATISAGVGGAIVGYSQSAAIATGPPGLLTLPIFYGEGFIGLIIGISVSFILSIALTYIVGFKDPVEEGTDQEVSTDQHVTPSSTIGAVSPLTGIVMPLSDVKDAAFSTEALGKGVAILPTEGKLYSPVTGVIGTLFPSKHAVGIVGDDGAEILVHVGLNTVQLNGEHFTAHIAQGDRVEAGQLLVEFDVKAIQGAGYDLSTPIVVTNTNDFMDVLSEEPGDIKAGSRLLSYMKEKERVS